MELYRQAREGFYLLCSLLLEPWIKGLKRLNDFFTYLEAFRVLLQGAVKIDIFPVTMGGL